MLSRKYRINKALFPAVTRGKIIQNEYLRIVIKQDHQLDNPKFAVIVSHKIAKKSVMRNLLRRQVFASIETCCFNIPHAFYSIFPKKAEISFELLQKSIQELLCLKK